MKPAQTRRAGLVVVALLIVIGVGILLSWNRKTAPAVALTLERYNYLDTLADDHCAFFRLTNGSDRPLLLTMVGGRNTMAFVKPIILNRRRAKPAELKMTWQVNGAFSDKTPQGWSNWVQQPSTNRASNAYVNLNPHTAMTVRLPMPTDGSKRRVAVIYQTGSAAWENRVLPKVIPHLPRWALQRLANRYSKLHEVWANGDFPPPGAP